jgi:predicted DsbA family dithiol-disulfide isomerase
MPLAIRVYSDYVCPFCFLAEFPLLEAIRGKDVEVIWMPFELRPYPTPTLRSEGEYLQNAWSNSVYPIAARMGVEIRLPTVSPQPYTRLAFEGLEFAKEHDAADAYNSAVMKAFFQQNQDIGDLDILTTIAAGVGLDSSEFEQALEAGAYAERHQALLRQAYEDEGVTGVPLFMIGNRVLMGLQSREAIETTVDKELEYNRSIGAEPVVPS